jgi:hypothetical protein
MKMKAVLLLVGLVVAVAAVFSAPSLDAAAGTETQITGAAAGVFPNGAVFQGLALQGSRLGLGVVVRGDGSAVGSFQTVLAATTLAGQPRSVSLEGKATRGSITAGGRATFSGTATLKVGDGPATTVAFRATATTSGIQLTVGALELPAQTLSAGSVFIS